MGRIVDLCAEVAAAADEGREGLVLSPETWAGLRTDWRDEDIEDALGLVQNSLLQGDLAEAADSLNTRLLQLLGAFGEAGAFKRAQAGEARIDLETIGHLVRQVARLEELLEAYREGASPDRRGFDALQRRLMDSGIEPEMGEEGDDEEAD
jgi:hypothetical protein